MMAAPDITELRTIEPPRLPVADVAIEQRVLGAILVNNGEFAAVAAFVKADDFEWALHQRIYQAIEKVISAGGVANPVTLKRYFASDEAFPVGGAARYLVQLATGAVTTRNAAFYAQAVADMALWRSITEGPRPGETIIDVLERHRDRLAAFRCAQRQLKGADGGRR
jgi:replicative DNA helicase